MIPGCPGSVQICGSSRKSTLDTVQLDTLHYTRVERGHWSQPQYYQGSHRNWKMKMVLERLAKSHQTLLSVMEFHQLSPEFCQIYMLLATAKKLSIDVKVLHFPQNATHAKLRRGSLEIKKWSWKSHEKVSRVILSSL